jgi:hypothetical protein
MEENEIRDAAAKLQGDLNKFKDEHPEEYLQLLKTLNQGLEGIASDLKKALGH